MDSLNELKKLEILYKGIKKKTKLPLTQNIDLVNIFQRKLSTQNKHNKLNKNLKVLESNIINEKKTIVQLVKNKRLFFETYQIKGLEYFTMN